MTFSEIALGLGIVGFGYFGIMLLVKPGMLRKVGIAPDNGEARTEIRAMYGGLELGIAAFLVFSLFHDEWLRPALLFQLLALVGLAAGRLTGIILEGGRVDRLLWLFTAIEVVAAAITCAALQTLPAM